MSTSNPYNSMILADHVSLLLAEWKVEGLVFTTYQYENDAFHDLILPTFLGSQLRPDTSVVRKTTEKLSRIELKYGCTVFPDHRCIWAGDYGATGVVDLIPVRRPGIFHPKVVVGILQKKALSGDPRRDMAVLLMVSSANLTKAGWQHNVEGVASRILAGDERPPVVDDIRNFLIELQKEDGQKHKPYASFLAAYDKVFQHAETVKVKTKERLLVTGYEKESFAESLKSAIEEIDSRALEGMALEVISPYTSVEPNAHPLRDLVKVTKPASVVVWVPLQDPDRMKWNVDKIDALKGQVPNVISWGGLDEGVLVNPDPNNTFYRDVHAKIYRWRSVSGLAWEITAIGSHNLTSQAFSGSQNIEASLVYVEYNPQQGKAIPWLKSIKLPHQSISSEGDSEDALPIEGTIPMAVVYDWSNGEMAVHSTDKNEREVVVTIGEIVRTFTIGPQKQVLVFSVEEASAVRTYILNHSFVQAKEVGGESVSIYVEQINLDDKPWLYDPVTLSDIIESLSTGDYSVKESKPEGDGGSVSIYPILETAKYETLHDRMAGLLRVPVKVSERIQHSKTIAFDRHLDQDMNPRHPLSMGRFVEHLVADQGTVFVSTDIYLTFKALEHCLSLMKSNAHCLPEYRSWYSYNKDEIGRLQAVVSKHLAKIRKELCQTLDSEGIAGKKFMNWMDSEISIPAKV